jgi:tyrosinase
MSGKAAVRVRDCQSRKRQKGSEDMAFTRQNVWANGGDFNDPTILWYARGVAAMQSRALNDPTAWRFFGAIHGFDPGIWQQLGYFSPNDPMPTPADQATFWAQCQHGTWYFLPWHRGYLIALEAMIRDAIKNMRGAPADWALPYWNYFKPNQNALPPAFASPDWPDGQGNNPLFVTARYGNGSGTIFVPMNRVNENALGDGPFVGPGQGGSQGFGGIETGFNHDDSTHGGIERQPHDLVHGLVGGGDPQTDLPGLMSDPDTAGLDPIFYLHHANIDRLWEVWKGMPTAQGDPDNNPDWANGPPNSGGQAFVVPMPGGASMTYTPGQMSNLATLNYIYDDTSPPAAEPQPIARLRRLGVPATAAAALARSTAMAGPPNVELLGANTQSIRLSGTEARTSVALSPAVKNKVTASLQATRAAAAAARTAPDRVFLNLENVRGVNDAVTFSVYINVPEGEDPAQHPELDAGTIGLFGVRKASVRDSRHAGDGVNYVLEITSIVDALHLSGALDANQIHVRLVPLKPVPDSAQISIGRISVYRQGS